MELYNIQVLMNKNLICGLLYLIKEGSLVLLKITLLCQRSLRDIYRCFLMGV
nr:hypothetical protein Iba_chr01bCG17850 [Ipomoea batatas]GMC54370.1 hypothetical protein Iba_chr01dCG15470 [Ipomoea batatas]GMC55105.1 hypothetical protein Iba_chr01eCG4290 [Ipomoea batatas]